jgi:hypothetical protein
MLVRCLQVQRPLFSLRSQGEWFLAKCEMLFALAPIFRIDVAMNHTDAEKKVREVGNL